MKDKINYLLFEKFPKLGAFWMKIKEYFLYLLFGGLTTVVNYVVYVPLTRLLHMDELWANVIAWIVAVAFAYITNRIWVFESKAKGFGKIVKEIGQFTLGRLFTLGLEQVMLLVFVKLLGCNDIVIKIIASVVTVILNYVFSKFIIFKKTKEK